MSAQIAATEIGLPLIEPELSIKIVTNVSLNSISFSLLKDKELNNRKNKTISLSDLKEELKKAIDDEEYEIAAKLRDKIIKLKS